MREVRVVAWLVVLLLLAAVAMTEEKKPVPTYTNEDLLRVRPFRGETGVDSRPAVESQSASSSTDPRPKGPGEAYWRREAERLEHRLRPLRARAATLRRKIDERWRKAGVRPLTDPQILEWERSLSETEAEIRDLEARFEERARRAGAMPGWLR